jgi:hypothetical protein
VFGSLMVAAVNQLPLSALELLALVSQAVGRWTLVAVARVVYAAFAIYLPRPTTTGFIHYDRTGVRLLLSGLLLGAPALPGAAPSPTGGLSPRAGWVAFELVALSTLGGWLQARQRLQGP